MTTEVNQTVKTTIFTRHTSTTLDLPIGRPLNKDVPGLAAGHGINLAWQAF